MAHGPPSVQTAGTAILFALVLGAGCLDASPIAAPSDAPQDHSAHGQEAMDPGQGAHAAGHHASHEGDPAAAPDLSHEHPFEAETGRIPSLDEAKAFGRKYSRFIAQGDKGIEKLRAEGHLQGDGTPSSPYVLEKFYVDGELSLTSLHKTIIVREGYVAGQFKLNYIGEQVYVHHVYAKDLRVNENIKRNGTNTGGLFHDNHFAFVGQIRHFTGEFRDNQVGPRPSDAIDDSLGDSGIVKVAAEVVFNFDGFHGADVHHNAFQGQVDIKLHGHNHGDCFTCPVHDHSDMQDVGHEAHQVDPHGHGFTSVHQVRYSSLLFRDNTIQVPGGIALRYNDLNHAGDDRTANSEPHKRLDDPHIHYQDVTLQKNKLVGGALLIDVFNAPDERHPTQNQGTLRILDNDVRVDYAPPTLTRSGPSLLSGIHVRAADGLQLEARNNQLRFEQIQDGQPGQDLGRIGAPKVELQGIRLERITDSNLTIAKTTVTTGRYGVWAQNLADTTQWRLAANTFQTEEAWRGKDVANPPKEE